MAATDQIRQMVNFILQEAHEKANEIRVKVRFRISAQRGSWVRWRGKMSKVQELVGNKVDERTLETLLYTALSPQGRFSYQKRPLSHHGEKSDR